MLKGKISPKPELPLCRKHCYINNSVFFKLTFWKRKQVESKHWEQPPRYDFRNRKPPHFSACYLRLPKSSLSFTKKGMLHSTVLKAVAKSICLYIILFTFTARLWDLFLIMSDIYKHWEILSTAAKPYVFQQLQNVVFKFPGWNTNTQLCCCPWPEIEYNAKQILTEFNYSYKEATLKSHQDKQALRSYRHSINMKIFKTQAKNLRETPTDYRNTEHKLVMQ